MESIGVKVVVRDETASGHAVATQVIELPATITVRYRSLS
jgi:hypothetical protein